MESIIDHVGINVSDYERTKALYGAALLPLDIKLLMEFPNVGGWARSPSFGSRSTPSVRSRRCTSA